MDLLLDTHVLLWWDSGDKRLGDAARRMIAVADNRIFISAASVWEISIKSKIGKLRMKGSSAGLIEANGFLPLPIQPIHAEAAGTLDWDHRDPFDRMLVVQAMSEDMVLVHADQVIRGYATVPQLWAARSSSAPQK